MTAATALDLLRSLEAHADLDVVVPADDVTLLQAALSEAGFVVLRDWLPTALAVRHPDGRELDLHPVRPTDDGGGAQELFAPDPPFHYGPPVAGLLGGEEVLCISAESQLRAHQGYEPQPEDRADVAALAARFGLPLPPGC